MKELNEYVEQARTSDYFSAAHVAGDLERFLRERGTQCAELGKACRTASRLFLVGSGGSLANLQSAKYLLDRVTTLPCDVLPSYELVWRRPLSLTADSIVVLNSWSGETEDTVAALRIAKAAGARTVALVRNASTTIGGEADDAIEYSSSALYELPLAALVMLASGLAEQRAGVEEAGAVVASLEELPRLLKAVVEGEAERAQALAREFLYSNHMYVLGAGPLGPLAWKVAMSVLMENVRIAASFCDASEFRHGPAEAMERLRPDMMFLVGTDESRDVTLRTLDFCKRNGAHVVAYDAQEFGESVHPMLTPIVMNSLTQWFVVYSAIMRGILNLDDRVFMGHNVLAANGARWP
jgi:fructoselysine 6-phosphate deglycase